jgi:hypothetical protein
VLRIFETVIYSDGIAQKQNVFFIASGLRKFFGTTHAKSDLFSLLHRKFVHMVVVTEISVKMDAKEFVSPAI